MYSNSYLKHRPTSGPRNPSPNPIYPGQNPGQNPRYPSQSSTNPGQNPRYPSQNPRYPSQNLTYPGQNTRYPSQNPNNPGQNPRYPSQNPTYPGQNPRYPSQNPTYPGQNPRYPSQNSTNPGQIPRYPIQNPTYPGQNPRYPSQNATNPGQNPRYPSKNSTNLTQPQNPPLEIKRYSSEPPVYFKPRTPLELKVESGPPPHNITYANDGSRSPKKGPTTAGSGKKTPYTIPIQPSASKTKTEKPKLEHGSSGPPSYKSNYGYNNPKMGEAATMTHNKGPTSSDRQPRRGQNRSNPEVSDNYENYNKISVQRARSRNMPNPNGVYEPNNPSYTPVRQSDPGELDLDYIDDDNVFTDQASPRNSRPGSLRSSSEKKRTRSAPSSRHNSMGTGSKSPSKANGLKPGSIYHTDLPQPDVPVIGALNQDVGGMGKRSQSMQSVSSKASRSAGALARRNQTMAALTAHADQKFSEKKKKALAAFSSVNYAPTNSYVYRDWLKKHPIRILWDRWILMILIGFAIGLLAALLKQILTALANLKWDKTKELARELDLSLCYAWTAGISVIFVIVSSVLVAFVHPPAGGSGVPEVISYLNGVIIHGTMSIKTLIVKFISLIFAVSSGIPAAIQGPIIAMGAITGLGIGQFKSKTLNIEPKWFSRFRTPEERRNFMTAGVAAGVAAAFNAPIGGLLFAQEDLSSFWNNPVAWQTFFCCGIATIVANMFNSAFTGFQYKGDFGLLSGTTPDPIPLNIISLAPAIALGIVGGLLGAFYTRLNSLIVKIRKTIITAIPHPTAQKFARVLETVIICMIMAATVVWLPSALPCSPKSQYNMTAVGGCGFGQEFPVEQYTCCSDPRNCTEYNEAATIFYAQGLEMWSMLTAKGVHRKFGYEALGYIFPIYFLVLCWSAGSAIAAGTFVPTLVSGALYGRAIGLGVLDLYTHLSGYSIPATNYWEWIDPGFMAVLGAGSLLAGVTRKQLAITVIIVEMSQDIDIICPLLLANFVAKMIADFLSKPLYKYQLEAKALPYLDSEITVVVRGQIAHLELYTAQDIMASPVKEICVMESIQSLAKLLIDTDHGGFPVRRLDSPVLYGLITRTELYVILCQPSVQNAVWKWKDSNENQPLVPVIGYEELSVDYYANQKVAEERVQHFFHSDACSRIQIDLTSFVNVSATKVDQHYSLKRTYDLFRTLGLRHLLVTDLNNYCKGIITRKDLMPFSIAENLCKLDDDQETGDSMQNLPVYSGTNGTESSSGSMTSPDSEDKKVNGMTVCDETTF